MHRVITQFARDKLNPADSVALHRRAVAYFDSKLKEQAGPDRGEYLYWYRYEQADWQTLMDAWLYHLSHAGDEDGAMVAFVRRYFDAFWWWGYYQRFQFSEQMIDEWSPRRLREDFRGRSNTATLRQQLSKATKNVARVIGMWGRQRARTTASTSSSRSTRLAARARSKMRVTSPSLGSMLWRRSPCLRQG
jgi:hypothetical protein